MINRRNAIMLASAGILVPTLGIAAAQGTPVATPSVEGVATPVASPVAETPARANWNMVGGNPARSGVMPGPIPSIEAPIIGRWRYQPENVWFTNQELVIADGVVYAHSSDYIHAVQADTGLEYWRYEFDTYITYLSHSEGTLYASSLFGIRAISTDTGLQTWFHGKTVDDGTPTPASEEFGSPVVVDGMVVVTGAGSINALDVETGELRWQFPTEFVLPTIVVSDGLVFGSDEGGAVALDLQTGDQVWRSTSTLATIAVADGIALTVGEDFLSGFDAALGQELWRNPVSEEVVTFAIDATNFYTLSATYNSSGMYEVKILATDLKTGGLLWLHNVGTFSDLDIAEMRIVRHQLFVKLGSPVDILQVIDVTTGLKTWEYRGYIARGVNPVAIDRNLYFVHDGELFCIGNLQDPALIADVTLRAAPAESGLERGTASAGDEISNVGIRSENNGELWVEVTIGGVTGWIPADAIDPATLPPDGDVWVIFDPAWS